MLTGVSAVDPRGYATTRYALELDGAVAGWLDGVSGGNVVGEVVTQSLPTTNTQKKHLGSVTFEDIVLTVTPAMPKPLFDWVKSSLESEFKTKGAIITVDIKVLKLVE